MLYCQFSSCALPPNLHQVSTEVRQAFQPQGFCRSQESVKGDQPSSPRVSLCQKQGGLTGTCHVFSVLVSLDIGRERETVGILPPHMKEERCCRRKLLHRQSARPAVFLGCDRSRCMFHDYSSCIAHDYGRRYAPVVPNQVKHLG